MGRVALIEKGEGDTLSPVGYRLLTILPALYRRWAGIRLRHLEPWIERWALPEMFAGVPARGASQGWWEAALRAEMADVYDEPWALACVDCYKCFDQVQRGLLYHALAVGGFPVGVLGAYVRYHESLTVRHTLPGGLGEGYARPTSIPQGCPWSMAMLGLLMRPWVLRMRTAGLGARLLADDFQLWAEASHGKSEGELLGEGLEQTFEYLTKIWGRAQPTKSRIAASSAPARRALARREWGPDKLKVKVVQHLRDLGAHLDSTARAVAPTLTGRLHEATRAAHSTASLPTSLPTKRKLAIGTAVPMGIYACEVCPVNKHKAWRASSRLWSRPW